MAEEESPGYVVSETRLVWNCTHAVAYNRQSEIDAGPRSVQAQTRHSNCQCM